MEITKEMIVKAWRDESFRNGLPEEVRTKIPAKPTGEGGRELSDAELEQAAGGIIGVVAAGVGLAAGSIGAGYGASALLD